MAAPLGAFVELGTVGPNITVINVFNLTPNTKYSFRVRAYKGALNSTYSNTASGKTKR